MHLLRPATIALTILIAGVLIIRILTYTGNTPAEKNGPGAQAASPVSVPATHATSDSTFKKDVLESALPVMVDFWAPWCGPCRIVGPVIDRVGEKIKGKANVFKLNVDDNHRTASAYGVTGIPTVIIFRKGRVDKILVGIQSEQVYLEALGG